MRATLALAFALHAGAAVEKAREKRWAIQRQIDALDEDDAKAGEHDVVASILSGDSAISRSAGNAAKRKTLEQEFEAWREAGRAASAAVEARQVAEQRASEAITRTANDVIIASIDIEREIEQMLMLESAYLGARARLLWLSTIATGDDKKRLDDVMARPFLAEREWNGAWKLAETTHAERVALGHLIVDPDVELPWAK